MASHRKPDPDQLGIDFSSRSAERFALLRALDLGISSEASRIGYLLELIAAIAGDGELDWPLARIGQRLRLPEITLRRTIEQAERIGVITVRRLARYDGTYGANALAIHWERIAKREVDPVGAHAGGRTYGPTGQRSTGSDRAINRIGPCDPVDRTSSHRSSTSNNPPPPPRTTVLEPDSSGSAMAAAVVRLCELGVADASAAVRQAMANGVTADAVLALAGHFVARPGAWGPGALHYRVRSAVPGLSVDQGWPPIAKGWIPPEQQSLRAQAQADQRAAEAAGAEANRLAMERREIEVGPLLDALPDEEVADLVAGDPFMRERLRRNGRASPMVRQWLLARMAERQPQSGSRSVSGTDEAGRFFIGRTEGSSS